MEKLKGNVGKELLKIKEELKFVFRLKIVWLIYLFIAYNTIRDSVFDGQLILHLFYGFIGTWAIMWFIHRFSP